MAGMPIPQPDPKQQLDAAHPIAPAAANQTSATADLINSVSPQGAAVRGFTGMFANAVKNAVAPVQKFADGTANVQPADGFLDRTAHAGADAFRQASSAFGAGNYGEALGDAARGVLVSPAALAATAANAYPPAARALAGGVGAAVGGFFGGPRAPIPQNAAEAGHILSAVTGVPAHMMVAPAAAAPVPTDTGIRSTLDQASPASAIAQPQPVPGTLEHTIGAANALNNPHQHTTPDFLQKLHGLTYNQITALMPLLAPNLAPQEQAFQALVQGQRAKAAADASASGKPVDPLTHLMQTYMERRAGVSPYSQIYPMQQLDENGNPVQ